MDSYKYLLIFFRVVSLALGQWHNCPCASLIFTEITAARNRPQQKTADENRELPWMTTTYSSMVASEDAAIVTIKLESSQHSVFIDKTQISNTSCTLAGNTIVDHWCRRNSACRRCSNYIFILDLTPGFNGLGKHNCKTRWVTFQFWGLVHFILEIWWYTFLWCRSCIKSDDYQRPGTYYNIQQNLTSQREIVTVHVILSHDFTHAFRQ